MKVAIIGSRNFNDYEMLEYQVTNILKLLNITPSYIVSGGANGADKLAEKYAEEHNIQLNIIYPDWKTHGKQAGYLRNIQIWQSADIGIAFWDGISRGTEHSFEIAKKLNKKLIVVQYENKG